MTRGPGDISGDEQEAFVLLELSDVSDRAPDADVDPPSVMALGSDFHALEVVAPPGGTGSSNPELDAILLAYLLELDDPVHG